MRLRGWKRFAARVLPEALKSRVRGRLYGYHDSRVPLSVEYTTDEHGSLLVLDGRVRLPFLDDERCELEQHLLGASCEETSGVLTLAASARTLFDVGAATALYSRLFCACGGGRRAVAYEPSPSQLRRAGLRIAHAGLESSIELRPCAVGQTPGRVAVVVADNGFASVETATAGLISVEVEMTTIDHEVERRGVEPDMLKIDVEGFEHEVLLGARSLLARRGPPICFELHLALLEGRGIAPRTVVEELQSHGYKFRTYHGRDLRPVDVWNSIHEVLRFVAVSSR